MEALRVYVLYLGMNLRAGLQYRGWPLMIIQTIVVVVTDPIGLVFLFHRFGPIGPWTVHHMLLVYAMAVTSFGLAETFGRGLDYFPWRMIRSGDFDRVLLRPQPLLLQIAGTYFHVHRLARVGGGLAAVVYCLWALEVPLTAGRLLLLTAALIGGFFTYIGVFIAASGIAFFTIQALDWIYIFTNTSYQVARIPVDVMPSLLRVTFTFVMPMLVASYYPAAVAAGWGEPTWTGWLAVPVGLLFAGGSVLVWRFGLRHYQSTGS